MIWIIQVNQLPNNQQKTHLDNKLDKLLKKLQVDDPAMEEIKQKLQRWSDLVRYCQRNPRYIFPEYRQVCTYTMLKTGISLVF